MATAAGMWNPDVVIGIDFGMTCTAVAWSMGPDWVTPKTIQHWPGMLGHELRNKVSTTVSYNISSGELANWGFLCDPDAETEEYNELFKLYLDPRYKAHSDNAPAADEVHRWFRDYLRCLREYVLNHLTESQPRFETKKIEFVFSVPTTWRDPAVLASIEQHVKNAGYGLTNRERARVYLTEAEAAAVYASGRSMQRNDVFLVCDAGGGTTDVNVLKLVSEPRAMTTMELAPLCWTEGLAAGSTLIDYKVSQLLMKRLHQFPELIEGNLDSIVLSMMGDAFLRAKCTFGDNKHGTSNVSLPIPGLRPGVHLQQAGIQDSCMMLAMEDLKSVFDEQVTRVLNLIDRQLDSAQNSFPEEQISYLILSGGLGSSVYLRNLARKRYQDASRHPNTERMKMIVVDEPQLAVVHGLVMARIQEVKSGYKVLPNRLCPVSYGIVVKQRYDASRHASSEIVLHDKFDGDKWVEDQIEWMIKQSELVDSTVGARKLYRMKIPMGQENRLWKASIVMSALPTAALPRSLRQAGCRHVCDVEFSLHPRDLKRKNRHWYEMSTEYSRAEFEIRMLVDTGLRFEVWGKDGLQSRAHEEIAVDWMPAES